MKGTWEKNIKNKIDNHKAVVPPEVWINLSKIMGKPSIRERAKGKMVLRWMAAACLLACVTGSLIMWLGRQKDTMTLTLKNQNEMAKAPKHTGMAKVIASTDMAKTTNVYSKPILSTRRSWQAGRQKCTTSDSETTPHLISAATAKHDTRQAEIASQSETRLSSFSTKDSNATTEETNKDIKKPTSYTNNDFDMDNQLAKTSNPHDFQRQIKYDARRALQVQVSFANGLYASNVNTMSMPASAAGMLSTYSIGEMQPRTLKLTSMGSQQLIEEKTSHHIPISLGMQISYPLSERWYLSSGVNYTMLNSDIKTKTAGTSHSYRRRLDYIGIPIDLQIRLTKSAPLQIYLLGGAQTDWNIIAKNNNRHAEHPQAKDRMQLSVHAAIGIQSEITPQMSIYAEPRISYYINNHSGVNTIYKQHPITPGLNIGMRYDIK